MEHVSTIILVANLISVLSPVFGDTYSVKIGTESHVNLVDSRFLSFTIDPKYLFSPNGKYKTKECICMASSLTPAYVRIAGPSTSQTTFHNSTISIDGLQLLDDGNSPQKISLNEIQRENLSDSVDQVSVSHEDWKQFIQWAKNTGFDLVFALNNEEKTASGMWDPNTALNILTVADKAHIGDIFWQLGYACYNQSIEEYLNDLETLRVITETFPSGQGGRWRVVGGDVTPCLTADSKSDFKDYVTLSDELFDAVFLNGNSSSHELARMSDKDRLKLLKTLSRSETPLWLTDPNRQTHELQRAADWMTSLGYSAKNGFAVHFRELLETELYEPTLSFYMALLFKNLVGERVLNVDIKASDATMFAHCTSLRHKSVPGAVTLYGVNMDVEPARFSIKLSKKEEGGDIMQFILGQDRSGNILVNGRAMYYEGDIKPVVKRVRPYKTLLINLPPKSFGFWVLANTQVDACYDDDKAEEIQYVEALPIENSEDYSNVMKNKRSINRYDMDLQKESLINLKLLNNTGLVKVEKYTNQALENRIKDLKEEVTTVRNWFLSHQGSNVVRSRIHLNKVKRQAYDPRVEIKKRNKTHKTRNHNIKSRIRKQRNYENHSLLNSKLISRLRNSKSGQLPKHDPNKINKRNFKGLMARYKSKKGTEKILRNTNVNNKIESDAQIANPDCDTLRKRKRRSTSEENVIEKNINLGKRKHRKFRNMDNNHLDEVQEGFISNEVSDHHQGINPIGKVIHKIKKLSELPVEIHEKHEDHDTNDLSEDTSDMDEIVLRSKFLDDSAIVNITEKSKNGFLRSTVEEILTILADLNKNLNKIWSTLTFLE